MNSCVQGSDLLCTQLMLIVIVTRKGLSSLGSDSGSAACRQGEIPRENNKADFSVHFFSVQKTHKSYDLYEKKGG